MTTGELADLDGPANFRDLGGYSTRGGRITRRRRVFRSDSLSYLSDRDIAVLRDELGVRTVIDLRAGHEVEDHGHGPLREHVRQLHLPIVDQTREPPQPRRLVRRAPRFQTLDEIYGFMLREYADRFGMVLRAISEVEHQPVVFHCAAGKDRTGLVAALILGVCEVPDESIVADFAVTEARMPTIIARHTTRADASDRLPEVGGQQYGAQAATMVAVLAALRAEHGSIEGYVRAAGVDDASITRLRDSLVAPA
ncbi:MAG: tyrosine-protein phosphatase [Acidimicrobiia bacterium]